MSFWEDLKLQYKIGDIGQKLIFINVIIFIICIPLFNSFSVNQMIYPDYIALSGQWKQSIIFCYTFFSYIFLHADIFHLLFNMIYLSFSARLFLTLFNQKQYLFTYIFGGIFAGIAFVVYSTFSGNTFPIVGASAAILATLFTVVFYNPNMEVRLLLIGNVKLWHIGLFMFILDVLYFRLGNTGGHVSHLAGVTFGYLNYFLLKNGKDLSKIFNFNFKKKQKNNLKKVYTNHSTTKSNLNNLGNITDQKKVDDILDKISKSGYDSLTKEEKEFLFKQQ